MQPQPDCCSAPDLQLIRRLSSEPPRLQDLRQCQACGTFWCFDTEERMNFSGGEDYYWEWYTRLTEAEAAALGGGEGEKCSSPTSRGDFLLTPSHHPLLMHQCELMRSEALPICWYVSRPRQDQESAILPAPIIWLPSFHRWYPCQNSSGGSGRQLCHCIP
jgi:hypothetical protein